MASLHFKLSEFYIELPRDDTMIAIVGNLKVCHGRHVRKFDTDYDRYHTWHGSTRLSVESASTQTPPNPT
jgi:hypothetical protein